MSRNFSSATVVIGALRVKKMKCFSKAEQFYDQNVPYNPFKKMNILHFCLPIRKLYGI